MRQVDVRLLGPFEIAVDAQPVAAAQWEHRRAQDLVKLLALSPAHRLTRDEVVEALWPHLDAKAGVANLHKAAHFARRALGWPDAIVLRRGVVELAPASRVDTDVEREIGAGWQGASAELLPDDRFEAWTEPHRDRLAQDRSAALRRQGRWSELLDDDPADEEATRAVLRERVAAGDRVGAARRFRRLRDALATLGLAPSEETVALWRELSEGEAVQTHAFAGAPLVGRDRERDVARATLDATARGTGGTLLILGDAGMGKTRFLDLLLDDARSRGWHTLRGAGQEDESRPPYAPIAEAIDPLVAARRDLLETLNQPLQRVIGLLCPAAGVEGDGIEAERHQVFAAVAQLLLAAARERGAVLVLEDLHVCDAATLSLTHYLARAARGEPLLIVLSARHGEAGPELVRVRASLREQRAGVELLLQPLPASAVASISARAAGRPLSETTVEAIVAAAAGNPFFAEELAASVDERGDVRVPEHLHEILDARLDRLGEQARTVVLLAAALQHGFAASDVAAVAGVEPARADAAVNAALRVGVLARDGAALRFRHPLLRHAARRRLEPGQLVDAHLRAAGRVRAPEQAAYHLLAAGRGRDAVPLLAAAARRAASVGAYPDGQRWVEQALEHAPAAARGELLELLGDLRHAAGDRRAAQTYAAATDTAPRDRRTEVGIKRARALNAVGDPAGALAILSDLQADGVAQQARLEIAHGMIAWFAGDLDEARKRAGRAAPHIGEADLERAELGDLQALIAHAAGTWEAHTEGRMVEVWHVPGLAGRVFDAYFCVTEYVLHSGDPYARLGEFAHRLREHANAAGARRGEAFGLTLLGEIELLTGDIDAARAHLAEAVTLSVQVGAIGGEALARARLGEALLGLGEPSAARAQLEEAVSLAHASSLADHLLYVVHAPLLRVPDDPAEALALLDRAEALLDAEPKCLFCPTDYYIAAATVCARAGEAARAHAFLAHAEHAAGLWKRGPWSAATAEARAAVLTADGDAPGAADALQRAVTGYATAGQRRNAARARDALEAMNGAAR